MSPKQDPSKFWEGGKQLEQDSDVSFTCNWWNLATFLGNPAVQVIGICFRKYTLHHCAQMCDCMALVFLVWSCDSSNTEIGCLSAWGRVCNGAAFQRPKAMCLLCIKPTESIRTYLNIDLLSSHWYNGSISAMSTYGIGGRRYYKGLSPSWQ